MCRHIYDWNIVNCDVKQPIYLTTCIYTIVHEFGIHGYSDIMLYVGWYGLIGINLLTFYRIYWEKYEDIL